MDLKKLRNINRKEITLIKELAINDFKVKYAGSYLGLIWSFVQPIITILIYWFVFQVGFRTTPVGDVPYIYWFICGVIPWFFFSEAINNASNSIIEYSYLVKKVVFNINILPIMKVLSSLFVHLFFILLIFILFLFSEEALTIYSVQALYYSICAIVLAVAISFLTSAIIPFLKDVSQVVNIILQFGFWITPIVWNYKILDAKYIKYFKLNPFYYVIEGYRESFIYKVWFWEHPIQTLYFWGVTFTILFVGVRIFKRLKRHFADVL